MKTLKALVLAAGVALAGGASAAVDVKNPGFGWTYSPITYSQLQRLAGAVRLRRRLRRRGA